MLGVAMKTTKGEVVTLLTQMIASASIFSVRPVWDASQYAKLTRLLDERGGCMSSLYLRFEQSFSCECTLEVKFERDWDAARKDKFNTYNVRCQLNWPSTRRDLSNAQASIALYSHVAALGSLIETAFNEIVLTDAPVSKEL